MLADKPMQEATIKGMTERTGFARAKIQKPKLKNCRDVGREYNCFETVL